MNKKNILIITSIMILIIVGIIFFKFNNTRASIYTSRLDDLISRQEEMDSKIEKYINSSAYTIEKPKIIINPYEISPLTALIIFKTKEETAIEVYVNDNLLVKTEKEINHAIPIYYLRENFDNIVKIIANKEDYTYTLKTNKLDFDTKTEITENKDANYKYLVSSSTSGLSYSMIDSNGNIIWHLNLYSQGMLEELPNGNFIISTEEFVTENDISNITGIYEMDYLGKIIKRIDTKYLYHHDFEVLDDNTLLVAGSNNPNHAMSIVYRLSLETGEIIDYIDFYEIFKDIDPEFDKINEKLIYGFGLNSVDYNENTNDLLVSMRCLNLVMSINYNTKEINWIYANPENLSESFYPYLLDSNEGYLYGMHDAKWIDDNTISIYNNNYNINDESDNVVSNKKRAEALILSINDNLVTAIKRLTKENKNSYAFGSYSIANNKHLVNYSYLFKDEAINSNTSIFDYRGNTYTNLVLYDDYSNKLFDMIIEDRIYQAKIFEIPIYKASYVPVKYTYLNNNDDNLIVDEEVLNKAKNYDNILDIYKNYIGVNISNDAYNELFIIFKGDKTYTIKYNKTKTYYNIDKGVYDVYIKMDGSFYNLNTKIRAN